MTSSKKIFLSLIAVVAICISKDIWMGSLMRISKRSQSVHITSPAPHSSVPSPNSEYQPLVFEATGAPQTWPPLSNSTFPNFEMRDEKGSIFRFSDFKAKVILIEPIGMTCPGCHAWAGASKKGLFKNVQPQQGLRPIEEYFEQITGERFSSPDVILVQLLLYSMEAGVPTTLADAKAWAKHFNPGKGAQYVVIAGGTKFLSDASMKMIPGFFLVDSEHRVLSDSTGHHPADSLYTHLLPLAGKLLKANRQTASVTKELLSVADSYRAIPHHQTTFDPTKSTMSTEQKLQYQSFFSTVDQAVVARVHYMKKLQSGSRNDDGFALYEPIFRALESFKGKVDSKILELIVASIKDQRDFLEEWNITANSGVKFSSSHPKVTSSSKNLHEAYALLINRFTKESEHNRKAFFDHLCALDFI